MGNLESMDTPPEPAVSVDIPQISTDMLTGLFSMEEDSPSLSNNGERRLCAAILLYGLRDYVLASYNKIKFKDKDLIELAEWFVNRDDNSSYVLCCKVLNIRPDKLVIAAEEMTPDQLLYIFNEYKSGCKHLGIRWSKPKK